MAYRIYGAFIASLSVAALMLATNETIARSAAAPRAGFASTHPGFRSAVLRHHRRNVGNFWPAAGDFYGPSNAEPAVDVTPSTSGEIHHTYTYDVPWDWAHRYPPSERPYVPGCFGETVAVAGRGGREQTVNI